jgi:hypothetical protein
MDSINRGLAYALQLRAPLVVQRARLLPSSCFHNCYVYLRMPDVFQNVGLGGVLSGLDSAND